MKKRTDRRYKLAAAVGILLLALPVVSLKAETKTYTLTLRAGNAGVFAPSKYPSKDGVEVTENYIRYQFVRGESLAEAGLAEDDEKLNALLRKIVIPREGYRLLTVEGLAEEEITKNTEYVLDYGRIVEHEKKTTVRNLYMPEELLK